MKKILPLLLFIGVTGICLGQPADRTVDSLNRILKTEKEDTSNVGTLIFLSRRLLETGDVKSALENGGKALLVAQKISVRKSIVAAYNNLGTIHTEQDNYTEALSNYLAALKLNEEAAIEDGVADSHIKIGNIYYLQDNYPEALKNYLVTLKTGEEIKNNQLIAYAYNNIGNIYKQQGNYTEALKNYFATLKLYQVMDNKSSIAFMYNNIGNIYLAQNDYPEALKSYTASMQIQETIGNKQGIAFSYINLGELYIKLKKLPEASNYLNKGLQLSKDIRDKQSIAVCYNNLGQLYIKLNNLPDAEESLHNGLQYSKEIGSKDLIKDCYRTLSELDSLKGNSNSALQYYQLYSQLKDSILNERSNKQVSQLKIQYETDKKDQQIKTERLQNLILQSRIYYGIAFSLFIIAIVVMLFYMRSRRRRTAYEHTLVSLELTALKSQLNPHFISNSLSAIKSFIDKQPDRASQFLSKFAKLMRRVLEQSELPSISLKEELETAELYMQIESLRLKFGFDYEIDCDDDIDQEMMIVPPLILQPSIENAIRHGLAPMEEKGKIVISIRLENGLLKFAIEDNGVGKEFAGENINDRPVGVKSFGLSITRKRIEVLSRLKKQGYLDLKFLPGRTITEVAFPVS